MQGHDYYSFMPNDPLQTQNNVPVFGLRAVLGSNDSTFLIPRGNVAMFTTEERITA